MKASQKQTKEREDCDFRFFAHDWLWALTLVIVTVFAYQSVWHAGFIWDDDSYVTNNPTLHSLAGLRQIWFEPATMVQYYPFTFTIFWLEYHLWGLNPLGYHLVNVLLHSCNAILLWVILRKLGVRGAWLAAGIFALHPVCVESVAWVTELKNTLSGLFYLGSIAFALKFWLPNETSFESQMTRGSKDSMAGFGDWKFYWLAFAFYICALWSKTTTLPLPVVILLLVWWKRGRVVWRDIYPLGLFLAVGVVMGLMTMHVENHGVASDKQWGNSLFQGCLLASRDVWFYLGKLFWPYPLISVYPRWTLPASGWTSYLPLLALVAALSILCWKRNSWGRLPLVALLYFVALLFLVLGFFNVSFFRYSFVADHFQYLASIGPLALAAAGITMAFGFTGKRSPLLKPLLCGALLLTLGALTWRQSRMYADDETLWTKTLDRNPACWLAHYNIGTDLLQKNQVDEAIVHFQESLAIKADNADAHFNLGIALFQRARVDEAIVHFQNALEIKPNNADAHFSLGTALFQKGRVDEAVAHFQRALEIKPDFAEACNSLGNALFQKGRTDEAITYFQKALAIQPDDAEAHYDLANAIFRKGRADEAIVEFQKGLAIQPDNAKAHDNLGIALFQKGRLDEAIVHFQRALAVQPDNAEVHNNLGTALVQKGRLDEAIIQFQKALAIQPDNADALDNLGSALFQRGQLDEAIIQLQKALEIKPGLVLAQNKLANIAWVLATSPDPSIRNGSKAVELAEQTDRFSGGGNPVMAATLAAAYAEAGRFPEAITNARRALQLASSQNKTALVAALEAQLKLYQAGSPFHQTGASH